MRGFSTLGLLFLFALACGLPVVESPFISTACAEEEDNQDEQTDETEETKNDTDQDAAQEEEKEEKSEDESKKPAAKETKDEEESPPPKKKKKQDEPVSKKEQEQAEKAADEEVSESDEEADRKEDEKAAAEEAAGAEVEIDESDDEEEEPVESEESKNKPPVVEDTPTQPSQETPPVQKRVIGATATLMEKQSELLFRARVDSGAKSCSLHIEDYKIENESDQMAENIGKVVRFHIKNGNGESHWLDAKIAGYVVVKTAAHRERRYKVPLTLRYKDFEKTVLVTLNNREKMEFPLLLGRNFLMGDFVVDVEQDNNELHTR